MTVAECYLALEWGEKVVRVTRLNSPESATDIAGDHRTLGGGANYEIFTHALRMKYNASTILETHTSL